MYDHGYVFTRLGKGIMHQTRSVRIDLSIFELSSENRRILKKNSDIALGMTSIPMKNYDWHIGKLAKDFYETKFGPNIMSAQKIKEILTDNNKSNFNSLLSYSKDSQPFGYAISFENQSLLHYSYPFYDLVSAPKDIGLGMMTMAIQYAKEKGLKYVYLGSLQRRGDIYKLQYAGLEWFDGNIWKKDLNQAKKILLTA